MSNHPTTIAAAVQLLSSGDVDGYISTSTRPRPSSTASPRTSPRTGRASPSSSTPCAPEFPTRPSPPPTCSPTETGWRCGLSRTHTGELFGVPPAGARINAEGITIIQFAGDRVVERWNRLDDIAFLTQIGAMPAAAAS
jgi:hypothetical protein